MKQRLILLLLCLCMVCGMVSYAEPVTATEQPVSTTDPSILVGEAYLYTGILYYCDAEGNKIVLKEVKPLGVANEQSEKTAKEADYTELCFSGNGRLANGEVVPKAELNHYVDSKAQMILVRSPKEGLRVVAFRFL